jgi:hypothetical protein
MSNNFSIVRHMAGSKEASVKGERGHVENYVFHYLRIHALYDRNSLGREKWKF